jgi:hypothetical protein
MAAPSGDQDDAKSGISRLNLKGKSHGKPKDVRPHETLWDLAYRQAIQRRPHLEERCNKKSQKIPANSRAAVNVREQPDAKFLI